MLAGGAGRAPFEYLALAVLRLDFGQVFYLEHLGLLSGEQRIGADGSFDLVKIDALLKRDVYIA